MRVGVIGHVEWVSFVDVAQVPSAGAITHARGLHEEAAGGGGVAAVELARLAGSSVLVTALGDDALGRQARAQLSRFGVEVRGPSRDEPQRRAITFLDDQAERTIIVIGDATAPRHDDGLDLADLDAIYFCKGDAALLRAARAAKVVVATARVLSVVREAGVKLDALVLSASDPSERYVDGDLDVRPRLVARTDGGRGGSYTLSDGTSGRWSAAPLPGPSRDAYGAGDSFAAALTWALACGMSPLQALELAATRGALALTRRGAHGLSG